jgi:hypothetical protein
MPVGQLVALLPAAVIAWRFTSGIAARAVVIMAAPLVPVLVWFLTGFLASTLVATAVALSWRALGKEREEQRSSGEGVP